MVVSRVDFRANVPKVSPARTSSASEDTLSRSDPRMTSGALMSTESPACRLTSACDMTSSDASENERMLIRVWAHSM